MNSSKEYFVYENSAISSLRGICEGGEDEFNTHPAFDISISAESTVISKRSELNSIVKELYSMGVFDPENRQSAIMLVEMMDFEGKDRMLEKLKATDGSDV